ncbi:hypothetical protein [Nostoc sp.]|uniref:hypothetical protein n=1 Tax=Nostoc sp. TaxID=1180 RepID=UPI002FF9AB9A
MSVLADNQLVGTLPVIPLEPNQLNLFSDLTLTPALLTEALVMSADALLKWKAQILDYQQRVRENKPPEQTTLFDLAPNHCDPDRIDRCSYRCVGVARRRHRSRFGGCQQIAPAMRVCISSLTLRLV